MSEGSNFKHLYERDAVGGVVCPTCKGLLVPIDTGVGDKREPSLKDHHGVLRLFIELHDRLGPRSIGRAINRMDQAGRHRRIDGVRYYDFPSFRRALVETVDDPDLQTFIWKVIP